MIGQVYCLSVKCNLLVFLILGQELRNSGDIWFNSYYSDAGVPWKSHIKQNIPFLDFLFASQIPQYETNYSQLFNHHFGLVFTAFRLWNINRTCGDEQQPKRKSEESK